MSSLQDIQAELEQARNDILTAKQSLRDMKYKELGIQFVQECGDDVSKIDAAISLLTAVKAKILE